MVSKNSNMSIGRTMMMCDFIIVGSAYFVLGYSLGEIVYGLLVTVLTGYMCDMIINSNRQAVQFTIISRHWESIAHAINVEANRGCTVFNGMGAYSHHEVKMLMVMCRRQESVTIYRIIKSIDDNAFITQTNVSGVYGNGFDKVKVRAARKKRAMAASGATPQQPSVQAEAMAAVSAPAAAQEPTTAL